MPTRPRDHIASLFSDGTAIGAAVAAGAGGEAPPSPCSLSTRTAITRTATRTTSACCARIATPRPRHLGSRIAATAAMPAGSGIGLARAHDRGILAPVISKASRGQDGQIVPTEYTAKGRRHGSGVARNTTRERPGLGNWPGPFLLGRGARFGPRPLPVRPPPDNRRQRPSLGPWASFTKSAFRASQTRIRLTDRPKGLYTAPMNLRATTARARARASRSSSFS